MDAPSLADRAVDTIAAVRSMDEHLTNESPERHAVRNLQRTAEDILIQAMRQARDLAYQAESLSKDMREAEKAAKGDKP